MKEGVLLVGIIAFTIAVFLIFISALVYESDKRWTAECKSNAALVTNATDRQYLNNRCYVVVDGKIKEIR